MGNEKYIVAHADGWFLMRKGKQGDIALLFHPSPKTLIQICWKLNQLSSYSEKDAFQDYFIERNSFLACYYYSKNN